MAFDRLVERWSKVWLVVRIFYGDDQKVVFTSEDLSYFRILNYVNLNYEGKIQHSYGKKWFPTEQNVKKVALYTDKAGKLR